MRTRLCHLFETSLRLFVTFSFSDSFAMQVGYKTILHLAIDEDDFDATPFVEACLKVETTSSMSYIFILCTTVTPVD